MQNMSVFAMMIIVIAVSTTLFGYRVTFANAESDKSQQVEALPFNAVTVYG